MRAIFYWLRLFVAVAILATGATPLNATSFNGQSYVSLAEFARANGFSLTSLRSGDEVILASKSGMRLVFDVNSAQAQIAGVNVRLSFPVGADHGQLFVSQLDIDTAIRPLIYPPRPSVRKITTICLDPGHGGKDPGNRVGGSIWGHSEKTYTLALAMELRKQLQRAGYHVILTRSRDVFVPLPDRPAIGNNAGADLFISLHFNWAAQGDISGPETYCITPVGAPSSNAHGENNEFSATAGLGPTAANHNENKSLLLAYLMERSLTVNLHANDRAVRRARFAVLRDATMPAILIEGGYMTSPVEGKKIFDANYRSQMATAIVRGIQAYQKAMALPVLHPAPQPNRLPPSHVSPLH